MRDPFPFAPTVTLSPVLPLSAVPLTLLSFSFLLSSFSLLLHLSLHSSLSALSLFTPSLPHCALALPPFLTVSLYPVHLLRSFLISPSPLVLLIKTKY